MKKNIKYEYFLTLTLVVGVISLIIGTFSIYFSIQTNDIKKIIEYILLLLAGIFLIVRSIKEIIKENNSYKKDEVHSN